MEKLISIIVPIYNAERYLSRCLDSLLEQTYKKIEIILVDDSSKDNSAVICSDYNKKDKRIHYYLKSNEGAGIARNYGIAHSSGELIAFCDADDYYEPEMIEHMVLEMEKKGFDLVYCLSTDEISIPKKSGEIQEFIDNDVWQLMLGEIGTKPEERSDNFYGSSVWRGLYKKSIITQNNIIFLSEREVGSEDLLFNLEYLRLCKRVVYIFDELYHHCNNFDSMTHSHNHFIIGNEERLYHEIDRIMADNKMGDYQQELSRMFIKRIRIAIIRLAEADTFIPHKSTIYAIRNIYNNELLEKVLSEYPGSKLPCKQAVFYFCMKFKLALLTHIICKAS